MARAARTTLKRVLWTGLLIGLGCSTLVEPKPKKTRCVISSVGGVDPCPSGETCIAGFCSPPCAGEAEICRDKQDNDCDGEIDERNSDLLETCGDHEDNDCDDVVDEGSDADEDGYAWCGDTRSASGRALIDCDDYNPAVHPGAAEVCDGSDNDCNGQTDEAAAGSALCSAGEECLSRCVAPSCAVPGSSVRCESGELCDPDTGSCVSASCGDVACPSGQFCNAATLTCVAVNRGHGEACASDADCRSGSCVDAASLLLSSGSGRVCGEACCNDTDCTEGELCISPGTGARSCLPTALVPVALRSAVSCTTRDACDGGDCRVSVLSVDAQREVVSAVCAPHQLTSDPTGALCAAPADCASGACVLGTFFGAGLCTTPCGRRSDCSYLQSQVLDGAFGYAYCRTLPVRPDARHVGFVPTCVIDLGGSGSGKLGTRCTAGSECEDGVCAATPSGSRCAPACCKDSDCTSGAAVGQCRPLAFGDHYEMRCTL
jgi:Putative metal-binding motif